MFDFSFMSDYKNNYLLALLLTLKISILVVIFGTVIGAILYFMKQSKLHIGPVRFLNWISNIIIEVLRGTPVLLQVMIAYSGIKMVFNISFSPFTAATIALSFNAAIYIAEVIRAGIESVPKGQIEAARSLGMSRFLVLEQVTIPQAVKCILPALGNEFVAVIKESSMASVIGVAELTFTSKIVQGSTYSPLAPLIVAAAFYFVITFLLGRGVAFFERRSELSDAK